MDGIWGSGDGRREEADREEVKKGREIRSATKTQQ
jgi:hypothetical protein